VVALLFPGGDFGDEAIFFVNASVEALAAQDVDFDFDHVQPTGVLGREVEFQAAQDAVGFRRRKGFVKCAGGMGREIVENDPDDVGLGVMEIDEIAHACGKILGGAPFSDLDPAPGPMRVEEDEEINRPIAPVFTIITFRLARLG
jgi:hypothetical protein